MKTVMVVIGNALLKDQQRKDRVGVGIGWTGHRKTKEGSQYRSYWSASVGQKETGCPAVVGEESGNDLR